MSMFRNIISSKGGRLPSGYQEVEYISCTGTQYINTGFKPNGKSGIEVSISSVTQNGVLFGAYNSGWTTGFGMYCNYGQDFWYHYFSNTRITVTPPNEFIMLFEKGKTIINGTQVAFVNEKTFTINYNLYLLAGNWSNSRAEQPTSCKLKYAKLYDNGTLISEYIPCYRKSDGEIGLYDIIKNVFKTNAGSGTFGKGGDVQ